ncbi:ribonuclease H-like domain-containing protein [Rhizophagus clarus]|uniref:Ribonuclease H-like domain-containing protein n=1 Tax=Rhizophagus clarus TaxID=94130 RepID=A0A8H3R9C0_9GLOM|nr:ribonuclease H-like domain-containing protein [Rhizophagus clarus]
MSDEYKTKLATKAEAFAGNNQQISHKKQKFNENSEQSQSKITDFHESSKLSQESYHEITRAYVKIFVICAYDEWTNMANESIWNFLIHISDHKEYLWCLKNLSEESHTGIFLAKEIKDIIKQIDPEKFSTVISDAGANI